MDRTVVVYTAPASQRSRDIERLLAEKGVRYKEVDVSSSDDPAMRIVARALQFGVPVTGFGDLLIVGFHRERLEKLLQLV